MPSVVAINISSKKGITKHAIQEAIFIEDFGIEGDAHGGNWHRQISLLGQESVDKIKAMGIIDLKSGSFAENITTEGIELFTLPIGTRLAIGETLHEVTQIGKECHKRCAIFHTVGDCVMPREGIFTKVLKGGKVVPGDKIEIL